MFTHSANCRWIEWEYPGHWFSAKILATFRPWDPTNHISSDSVQGTICHQKLYTASLCDSFYTGQDISNNQWQTQLHCWHWGPETTLDIRTLYLGQFRRPKTMYHSTAKLRSFEVSLKAGDILGILDTEEDNPIPFSDESLATICEQIHQRLPKVKKRTWTRKEIEDRCHLGAPESYRSQYIDILFWHQAATSMDKYDLGLAKDFTHRIHLKDDQPIFRKQFNLPEAHTQFTRQSLVEWLKLGVVWKSNSPYNLPIFCVPKK